jgi:ribonucleotide monophosphatase NagD (HAD superfamily)
VLDGVVPDAGSLMAAIQAASGRGPDVVIGKPSPILAKIALRKLGVPAQECLLTGDRLATDIAFGRAAGMATALVLTGVTTRAEAEAAKVRPDYVWESVRELSGGLAG